MAQTHSMHARHETSKTKAPTWTRLRRHPPSPPPCVAISISACVCRQCPWKNIYSVRIVDGRLYRVRFRKSAFVFCTVYVSSAELCTSATVLFFFHIGLLKHTVLHRAPTYVPILHCTGPMPSHQSGHQSCRLQDNNVESYRNVFLKAASTPERNATQDNTRRPSTCDSFRRRAMSCVS